MHRPFDARHNSHDLRGFEDRFSTDSALSKEVTSIESMLPVMEISEFEFGEKPINTIDFLISGRIRDFDGIRRFRYE
jgi:hypothetical protein